MELKSKGSFLFITLLVFSFSSQAQYTKINNNISIKFEGKHIPAPQLIGMSNNKSILWFEKVYINNEEHLFGLSKYVNTQKAGINVVFDKYIRSVTPPLTSVLEAGTYKKDGLTFYYKITQTQYADKIKRTNTMYYLMPGDFSEILYEFKITSNNYKKILVMNYLENLIKTLKLNY